MVTNSRVVEGIHLNLLQIVVLGALRGKDIIRPGRILPEETPHPTDTPNHLMGLVKDTNPLDKTDIVRTIALRNKLHAIDLQNPKAVQNRGRLSYTISLGECHQNTGTLKI